MPEADIREFNNLSPVPIHFSISGEAPSTNIASMHGRDHTVQRSHRETRRITIPFHSRSCGSFLDIPIPRIQCDLLTGHMTKPRQPCGNTEKAWPVF